MSEKHDTLKGKLIVGIDLGTTNSGVAVWDNDCNQVIMLEDSEGRALTPSVVGWSRPMRDWVVGYAAKMLGIERPRDVAYSIKRYIGCRFTDPAVRSSCQDLTYRLVSGDNTDQLHEIEVDFGMDDANNPIRLTAPQVSAKVLFKLRQDSAKKLNIPMENLKYAVITVPAYFNVLQRRATIEAGREAGFEVVDILNEPTAAALAYSDTVLSEKERRILVYDLGGGTFDISLLQVSRDEIGYIFYTRIVDGDTRLGGDDIDASVARWLAEEIEKRYGYRVLPDDQITRERLRRAAEEAKIELSKPKQDTTLVELPALDLGSCSPFDAQIELTRIHLEKCAGDVIKRTLLITKRAVESIAGLTWNQIDEVILVGGQTLMPAIQREVEVLTGHKPRVNDQPQLAVARGAGEYAHILSLGQEKFQQNTLINVIALPLGIRLNENDFQQLVPANVTLPHVSEPYPVTTTENNQTLIHVEILQGKTREAKRADQCVMLDSIDMEVLPAPARDPKFEVRFDVQADGTMKVSVTDSRRKRQEIRDIVDNKQILAKRDRSLKEGGAAEDVR